jgi:hypothetical protein
MKCDDVRGRLPELALGDLDAEPARKVELHLGSCAVCRAERDALARTAGLLRAPAPAPSTRRREAAVAAMARAREEVMRPRGRRGAWVAAAVALVAAAAFVLRPTPTAYTAVSGSAELYRAATGRWAPLAAGDVLRPGDRLRGDAKLAVEGGWVALESDGAVAVLPEGRLSLERGRLRAELGEGALRPLVVTDTGDNSVSLRRGRLEAALQPARGGVAGAAETRDGASRLPAPRMETALRLWVRVTEGEADLGGSHEQRLRLKAGQDGTFSIDGQPSAVGR